VRLAWNLANHGRYSTSLAPPIEPHLRFPPGYPLLLAPFFVGRDGSGVAADTALRQGAAWAMRAQVMVGSLLPVLVVLLGLRIMPPTPAWLAGILTAGCPVLVTSCSFLMTEIPFSVLLLGTLLVVGRRLASPTLPGALAAGILCGYLVLTRSFALLLPGVAALHLAGRGSGPGRRAAAALLAAALLVVLPWWVRNRVLIADGVPAPSYLAEAIGISVYPDLRGPKGPRGFGHLIDPEYPRFTTSLGAVLAELRRRVEADPWPQLRWHLAGRWLMLWEFHQVGAPPIHLHVVRNGLFRPAHLSRSRRTEPLAAVYWVFRGLYYLVVPAVLVGAVLVARRWRDPPTVPQRNVELLYLVLAYTVVVNGLICPLPRYLWPVRPLLYLLAAWSFTELARLVRARRMT
jgi:hypothetical protein